eukprot:350060-Chlamydomonas_euryale.AAC.4
MSPTFEGVADHLASLRHMRVWSHPDSNTVHTTVRARGRRHVGSVGCLTLSLTGMSGRRAAHCQRTPPQHTPAS